MKLFGSGVQALVGPMRLSMRQGQSAWRYATSPHILTRCSCSCTFLQPFVQDPSALMCEGIQDYVKKTFPTGGERDRVPVNSSSLTDHFEIIP
jgi:hypothetical protein